MSAEDKFLDFEISIWAEAGGYRARVHSPAGTSAIASLPDLIGSPAKATTLRLRLENSLLRSATHVRGVRSSAERHLEEFGRSIFDGLLGASSPFAVLFRSSLDLAGEREGVKGLRVVLDIDARELAQLPWEYLYNAANRDWLGLNFHSPIIRFLVVDRPTRVLNVDGALNVLGMIANPGGEWERLDADEERNRIEQAIKNLHGEGKVNFEWVPGGTLAHLRQMVDRAQRPWHVFHFIGHGGVPEPHGEQDGQDDDQDLDGFLVFTDEQGGAKEVPARDVCQQLQSYRHDMPRLVVLNSCEGASSGHSGKVRSPAEALIRAGVPAVVAMQFPISDRAAIQFGEAFYSALADNLPLEAALTCARKGIHTKCPVEWGIPVLYTRARGANLFSGVRAQPGKVTPTTVLKAGSDHTRQARHKLREMLSRPQPGMG